MKTSETEQVTLTTQVIAFSTAWQRQVSVNVRFASKGDAPSRYVTIAIGELRAAGAIPEVYQPKLGEIIVCIIDEQMVYFRVNRRNARTAAAHFPEGIDLPTIEDGFLHARRFDVFVVGTLDNSALIDLEIACMDDGRPAAQARLLSPVTSVLNGEPMESVAPVVTPPAAESEEI